MICRHCGYQGENASFVTGTIKEGKEKALCKKCKSESDKSYREKNRELIAKHKTAEWHRNEKARIVNRIAKERQRFGIDATEYVKTRKCEICGMTNEEHLERFKERLHIHHKNNDGRHNIRLGMKTVNNELEVLCRPDHVREDNKNRDYSSRKRKINSNKQVQDGS